MDSIKYVSKLFSLFDKNCVDGFGPGGAMKLVNSLSKMTTMLQTGYVVNYTLYIILAMIMMLTMFVVNYIKIG